MNQALIESLKRYPYLKSKLVELDGDFYIVSDEVGMIARKSKTLASLGHISAGYHLIDVAYYEKTLYISWHHALCDGRGIKPFVETIIYYYCKFRYQSDASSEGIRLSDSPLLEGENIDPNLESYSYDESKKDIDIPHDGYAIPENIKEEHETDYRYYLEVQSLDFMRVCKEVHATPAILISLLVSKTIAKLYPDFDKPIIANIATDIREALDIPNTFKNCVRSLSLPYTRDFLSMSLEEQAKIQRELLNAQRDRDRLRKAANESLALFNRLDSLNGYKEKQKLMDFFNGMLLNTYVISYLGILTLNENEKYVESASLYNSGAIGLGVTMVNVGDKFCINFKQSFESDKYVKGFLSELDILLIPYKASEVIPFLTPKDRIIKRD